MNGQPDSDGRNGHTPTHAKETARRSKESLKFPWPPRATTHPVPLELIGGSAVGLFLGTQVSLVITPLLDQFPFMATVVVAVSLLGFAWGGGVIGLRMTRTTEDRETVRHEQHTNTAQPKLLDTSTIIDGRIAELCTTGFFEGPLLIPTCVLVELQTIADSTIPDRRARGKRGLEILARLQDIEGLTIHTPDPAPVQDQTVDWQLIHLANIHQAKLVTNDWNLKQVATPQGVRVLSVNELCFRIKPVVLPGDLLRVFLFKEGHSPDQAIAHLDDGTLVVVAQARRYLGTNVDIIVESLHQTQSGIMIFASLHTTRDNEPSRKPSATHRV